MMETILSFITEYVAYAPLAIFSLILLAGLNIPVSIDALMVLSAILSARVAPEMTHLFVGSMLFGCIFSAWISFSLGRLLGPRVEKIPFLSKERLASISAFYAKFGLPALIIGRFIPFGVRNVLFLSKGMSSTPFYRFALFDAIACTIWVAVCFTTFYFASASYESLMAFVKKSNIAIFSIFGVSIILFLWYKSTKKKTA